MQRPNVPDISASCDFHSRHPEISIDQHVKAKALELSESIYGVEKIYLDTRFWVLLRDAYMGRSTVQAAYELLSEIRAGVAGKKSSLPD